MTTMATTTADAAVTMMVNSLLVALTGTETVVALVVEMVGVVGVVESVISMLVLLLSSFVVGWLLLPSSVIGWLVEKEDVTAVL